MCIAIIDTIASVQYQIETPKEFEEHFGFKPIMHKGYQDSDIDKYPCNCPMMIKRSLDSAIIKHTFDGCNVYITPFIESVSGFVPVNVVKSFVEFELSHSRDMKNDYSIDKKGHYYPIFEKRVKFLEKRLQYLTQFLK